MKRTYTPRTLAERGRTVMRITNPAILSSLDDVLSDIKKSTGCRRRPGIQVALDCLLQFWFRSDPEERSLFLKIWTTPVVGYPNSTRANPGQFARLKDWHPNYSPAMKVDEEPKVLRGDTPYEMDELVGPSPKYRGTIKVDPADMPVSPDLPQDDR